MTTTNPQLPTAVVTAAESPWLDNDWLTPENVMIAGDATEAAITAATFDSPDQSYVLKAYTFSGLSGIPDNAVINGVIVTVNAHQANGACSIDLVQLLDTSLAKGGTNQAATPSVLGATAADYTFGTSTALWGLALTPSWVKNANFGVALGILATAANADVFVDSIQLEVFYTTPASVVPDVGSYTTTGVNPTLQDNHINAVDVGTYQLAGIPNNLAKGFSIAVDVGGYEVKSIDPDLAGAYTDIPAVGTYATLGTDPNLLLAHMLGVLAGTYAVAGVEPELIPPSAINGAILVTWVEFRAPAGAKTLYAEIGPYSLSGIVATLAKASLFGVDVGTYQLSAPVAGLQKGYSLAAAVGSYTASGIAAALDRTYVGSPVVGSYSLVGISASFPIVHGLVAAVGSYNVAGIPAELLNLFGLAADTGSYAVTGVNPALVAAYKLDAATGSYALSGIGITLGKTYQIAAATGLYNLAGNSLGLLLGRQLAAALGSYATSGLAVSFPYNRVLPAGTGSYNLLGVTVQLLTVAQYQIDVDAGVYLVTGIGPTLKYALVPILFVAVMSSSRFNVATRTAAVYDMAASNKEVARYDATVKEEDLYDTVGSSAGNTTITGSEL